jgi:hypothetical protein
VSSHLTLIAAVLASLALPAAARADFYIPPNPLPPGRRRRDPRRAADRVRAARDRDAGQGVAGHVPLHHGDRAADPRCRGSCSSQPPDGTGQGRDRSSSMRSAPRALGQRCAPSLVLASGTEYEAPVINQAPSGSD